MLLPLSGTKDISKHDILTKLNCKDIDDTVIIVTIQFIYDCIESNKLFDKTESTNYIVKPKIIETIIIDDDDDIGIKKRSIVEHNASNKVKLLLLILLLQPHLILLHIITRKQLIAKHKDHL